MDVGLSVGELPLYSGSFHWSLECDVSRTLPALIVWDTFFYWISGAASFVPLSLRWPVGLLISGPLSSAAFRGQRIKERRFIQTELLIYQLIVLLLHGSAEQGKQMANKRRSFRVPPTPWGGSWNVTAALHTLFKIPQTLPSSLLVLNLDFLL